jgi:hypothetical protein
METSSEVYLGQGPHASIDEMEVVLRAPGADGEHVVKLGPMQLRELIGLLAEHSPALLALANVTVGT